jgi:hypothetical protein
MRPVDPHAIAHLASQQRVARHAQSLGLRIEQCVLDRPQPFRNNAAGRRPGKAIELGVDPLVVKGLLPDDPSCEALDNGATPGEPKPSSNSLQPMMPSSVVSFRK